MLNIRTRLSTELNHVCVEYLVAIQFEITLVRTIMFSHKHVHTILWQAPAREVCYSLRIRRVSRKNYTHIETENTFHH
jgi:hypothetical protein